MRAFADVSQGKCFPFSVVQTLLQREAPEKCKDVRRLYKTRLSKWGYDNTPPCLCHAFPFCSRWHMLSLGCIFKKVPCVECNPRLHDGEMCLCSRQRRPSSKNKDTHRCFSASPEGRSSCRWESRRERRRWSADHTAPVRGGRGGCSNSYDSL